VLSAFPFLSPLGMWREDLLKHSWQHFIWGYRLCTVNVESIEPYIRDQKMSRLFVPTSLFSCITLCKYERGRSQCFPTQVMHGSDSLLPFVFYLIGLSDRAGILSWQYISCLEFVYGYRYQHGYWILFMESTQTNYIICDILWLRKPIWS